MALKPSITVRTKQRLAMTQRMRQSVQILAMTHTELSRFLAEEQDQNPLMEVSAPGPSAGGSGGAHDVIAETATQAVSLFDRLLTQLTLSRCDETLDRAARVIIGYLSDTGLLNDDLDEIADATGLSRSDLDKALSLVQGFEPAGVAGRGISESWRLQLQAQGAWSDDYARLLVLLDKGVTDIADLARQIGIKQTQVRDHLQTLRGLTTDFSTPDDQAAQHVTPDVLISVGADNQIKVELNTLAFPRVSQIDTMVSIAPDDAAAQEYLQNAKNRLRWIKTAMDKRAAAILSVCETLITLQSAYFLRGADHLLPLTKKELAEKMSVHETTVGRAVNGKYFQFEGRTLPLNSLFSRAMPRGRKDQISTSVIRLRIRQIVETEAPGSVFSDLEIKEILARDGIIVARRTIAKYREDMDIPKSSIRHTLLRLHAQK